MLRRLAILALALLPLEPIGATKALAESGLKVTLLGTGAPFPYPD